MIAAVFSAEVFVTQVIQTKVNLYGVLVLTVVAVVSGYYIGFMAYQFGDFIVSILRLCMVAIGSAFLLIVYTRNFNGENMVVILSLLLLGLSVVTAVFYLNIVCIVLVFKPRV